MARITVCIPAFNSGKRVLETLKSVQHQSFAEFKVRIAIEPTGPDAFDEDVLHAFDDDERFAFVENSSVLGWAGNISNLITHVDTELFAILPHDDVWDKTYLAKLLPALDANRDASVAYADMQIFGEFNRTKTVHLDNTDMSTRLLTFYLEGAEAVPWRGVTRRVALSHAESFPQHKYMSFAVDCEYAQRLVCSGKTIRLGQRLYNKRTYAAGALSVSNRWRTQLSDGEKSAAIELHRVRMLRGIPGIIYGSVKRETIVLACEIAMLRRARRLLGRRFALSPTQIQRVQAIRRSFGNVEPGLRKKLSNYFDATYERLTPKWH